MCGIVGLFLKDPALEPKLGAMLARMLEVMSDRGPDSAGFAVYGHGGADRLKLTVRGARLEEVADALGPDVEARVRDTIWCCRCRARRNRPCGTGWRSNGRTWR